MDDREFAAALCDRDAILILSHLRPDGDTLGSGAALCSALRRMGKTAYLFSNPETTARYLPYVAQFFAPADFVPACVVAVDIATPDLFPQGFSGAVDLASTTTRRTRCMPELRSCTRRSLPAARRCSI